MARFPWKMFCRVLQWGRVLMNAETVQTGAVALGLERMVLQWGRVLMNAETRSEPREKSREKKLQWGRVLMNAETDNGALPVEDVLQ